MNMRTRYIFTAVLALASAFSVSAQENAQAIFTYDYGDQYVKQGSKRPESCDVAMLLKVPAKSP